MLDRDVALAVEGAYEGRFGDALGHGRRLTFQRLFPPVGAQTGLPDLVDLEPRMAAQQPLVVRHVIGERRTPQTADADDHDPHGAILVRPWSLQRERP